MAGDAKPNVPNLGREGRYEVLSCKLKYTDTADGLFSGKSEGGWLAGTAAGTTDDHFVEIKLYQRCRIWRTGYSAGYYVGKLRVHKKSDDGTYVKISDGLPVTQRNNTTWELFTDILLPGTYKFGEPHSDPTNYGRIDSEWWIEAMESDFFLFQKDNNVYTIRDGGLENLGNIIPTYDTFLNDGVENITKNNLLELRENLGEVKFLVKRV